jgi:hypothetical protein
MYRLQQQQFLSGGARVERSSALGGSSLTLPFPSIAPLRFSKRTSGSGYCQSFESLWGHGALRFPDFPRNNKLEKAPQTPWDPEVLFFSSMEPLWRWKRVQLEIKKTYYVFQNAQPLERKKFYALRWSSNYTTKIHLMPQKGIIPLWHILHLIHL